jgi:hypothetical protein
MSSIFKYSLCVLFAFSGWNISRLQAQTFVKTRPFYVQKYYKDKHASGFKACYIESPFAKSVLQKKVQIPDLNNNKILGIDYYYTQYRSAKKFQQVGLDRARFKQLEKDYPSIYHLVDSVPVRFIEQVLAKTKEDAKTYYHGFVIHYQKDRVDQKERLREIRLVDKLFDREFEVDKGLKPGDIKELKGLRSNDIIKIWNKEIDVEKPDATVLVDVNDIENQVKKTVPKDHVTCYVVEETDGNNKVRIKLYHVPAKNFPGSTPPAFVEGVFGLVRQQHEDSKLRFLAKQKHTDSNELSGDLYESLRNFDKDSILVVIDVTGSMGASIAQVLKWLNSVDTKRVKGIVLFNDGDNKKDIKKRIGATGGIYHCKNFSQLRPVLMKAMQRGSGGDPSENDVEAMLFAEKKFGKGNIVLVADNLAHPRDLPLLIDIESPVHLLICNALFAAPYYVNVKKKTKGTIINVLPKMYK